MTVDILSMKDFDTGTAGPGEETMKRFTNKCLHRMQMLWKREFRITQRKVRDLYLKNLLIPTVRFESRKTRHIWTLSLSACGDIVRSIAGQEVPGTTAAIG